MSTPKRQPRLVPPSPDQASDTSIDTTVARIVFAQPGPDTPGFLRRQRIATSLTEQLKNPTPHLLDDLTAFLLDFIVEPEDRTLAREALEDASEVQFQQMLHAVVQGTGDSSVPLESSAR